MRTYLVFIGLLLGSLAFGSSFANYENDNPESILANIKANYENLASLEINMRYQLFKGFDSAELIQESNSVFCRKGNASYRKIETTELISNAEYTINIDHENRKIMVSDPVADFPFGNEIKSALNYCKDVRVLAKDGGKVIDLTIDDKVDLPYGRVLIAIDKKYRVQKIEMHYTNQMDFSTNYFEKDLAYPRLVIFYDVFKPKWKDKDAVLSSSNYIENKEGNITPSALYKQYELYDLRNSKKN